MCTNIVLFRFLFCANQHSLPKCPAKSARNLHKRRLISRPVSCFELFMLLSPEFQLPLTAFLHPGTARRPLPQGEPRGLLTAQDGRVPPAFWNDQLHKNAQLGAVSPQIGYLCHKGTGTRGHRAPGHPLS